MTDSQSRPEPDGRPPFDPDAEEMRRIGYELIDRAVAHLTSLPEQRVGRRNSGAALAELVDEPLPVDPRGADDSLQFFFERAVPEMTRVNHPRFHAFIPCPSSFVGAVGEMLAAVTNPFVGSWLGGSTLCALELTVLRWIAEMLGYPTEAGGLFTSGGSTANLVGLCCARAKFPADAIRRGVIYVSREGHASVDKAANILGFPAEAIRTIDVDQALRMRADLLSEAVVQDRMAGRLPLIVVANAGTTNTGAIDPLPEIAAVCAREELWFHVDAAYGGFAALVPEERPQLEGMQLADSLTLDPHKWLYCPMGTGCVLVRDPADMERAFGADGHYLRDLPQDEVNFLNRGPELSRPARVLGVWMVIRSAGRNALTDQIRADLRLAELAAQLLRDDERLDVLPRGLSIVPFRHRPRDGETEAERAARDDALLEATLADGELMVSSTLLGGVNTLRFVVMNHRTTETDVRRSVQRIRELMR